MVSAQLGQSLNLHGYETYTAMAPVATNVGQRNARFIVLYDSTHAWLFTGVSRSTDSQRQFDKQFEAAARSFHRLSPEEKKLASGLRLRLLKAGADTRIEALARQSPIRKQAEAELRLLNGLYPKGEPQPGQLLKVVR